MATLRGLAWDHRRCWGPLDASVASYGALHPELDIIWDRRSLYEFGEGALDTVLSNYDLIVFDHPFIGEIAEGGLMVPFDDHLSAAEKTHFESDSVGKSWQSYQADGVHWALPIDAACQVSSYRPDLLASYGDAPKSHKEVVALGKRLRRDGKWLGLPWVPTDAMCLLLTLSSPQADGDDFIDRVTMERVVGELRELVALSHPKSRDWNPIRCYDHMIANDDVVYVPFAFGYVNYASHIKEPHLRFTNVPTAGSAGALLGGAGIGVSAKSKNRKAAIDYARYLCMPDYQRGDYVRGGGQPGSLAAWRDDEANKVSRDFFRDTLATIQASYLRPTHSGFLTFFREAAPRFAAAMAGEVSVAELHVQVNRLYRDTLPGQAKLSVA